MYRQSILGLALALATVAGAQTTSSSFSLLDHKTIATTEKDAMAWDNTKAGAASKDKKSIQFKGDQADIFVHTGPDEDMLSFRIQGLRNPTLIVKPGATLHFTFANTDDDMLHDIRFGTLQTAYPVTPSKDGTVGSDALPHKTDTSVSAETFTIVAPTKPGAYSYFCSMKGHAKGGMFGKVVVK